MRCACLSFDLLSGSDAQQYAAEHLVKEAADPVEWTVDYRCPGTGRRWVLDYPESGLHGGGPPRLRLRDP